MELAQGAVAILPCNDLDASEAFYARLGFTRTPGYPDYRILTHPAGLQLHLNPAVEGWVEPKRNPFGVYLYVEDVDALAAPVRDLWVNDDGPRDREWGMYEVALSDPDGVLVRIGWPTRLRSAG